MVLRIFYDGSLFRCQKKENSVTNQSEESLFWLVNLSSDGGWLTVFGNPETLGLVFADAKQHNGGVEGCSDFCLLQQVINHLDLVPAGTQQHCNGLRTDTSTQQEAHIQRSERRTPKYIRLKNTTRSTTWQSCMNGGYGVSALTPAREVWEVLMELNRMWVRSGNR